MKKDCKSNLILLKFSLINRLLEVGTFIPEGFTLENSYILVYYRY